MGMDEYFKEVEPIKGASKIGKQFIGGKSPGPGFGKSSVEGEPGTIDAHFNRKESTTDGIQCSGKPEASKDYLNDVKTGAGEKVYHSITGELLEDNTPEQQLDL